jgi:hypothetical protein
MRRQSIWEYFRTVYARYRRAERGTKQKMLDEFCANTRYHREHALRLLNGPPPGRARRRPLALRIRWSSRALDSGGLPISAGEVSLGCHGDPSESKGTVTVIFSIRPDYCRSNPACAG